MIFCKHCKKQVFVGMAIDMDVSMWRHLREKHPDVFKKEQDKELSDIFADNFTADNPESDYESNVESIEVGV